MSLTRDELRAFLRQCDPKQSLGPDDPRYVSLDPLRSSGTPTCIEILEQNIALLDESCQLFTGFSGTGKTTELRRLEGRLTAARDLPTHVVYVDFEEYHDLHTPIAITDVLRVLAYCLDREATTAEGGDPEKKPGYLRRLFDFMVQTDVKLKDFGVDLHGAKLMLELRNTPGFRQRAQAALEGRFQQFAEEAKASMSESIVRLRQARGAYAERIVVLADSLEKLRAVANEGRRALEESLEMVFVNHADHLRLPCHAVYTFPLSLRYRRADIGAGYDGEPLVLPMVKVAEPGGAPYEAGIQKLTELVARRLDVARVFGADTGKTLTPLLSASGGYPRDLLRMIRSLLTESRAFPIRPEDTARIIGRLAEDYSRTLFATDLDMVSKVAETHALPRGGDDDLVAFARLLDRYLVLAYRNGTEWYDLHPMIRRDPMVEERLKAKPVSSS